MAPEHPSALVTPGLVVFPAGHSSADRRSPGACCRVTIFPLNIMQKGAEFRRRAYLTYVANVPVNDEKNMGKNLSTHPQFAWI